MHEIEVHSPVFILVIGNTTSFAYILILRAANAISKQEQIEPRIMWIMLWKQRLMLGIVAVLHTRERIYH